MRISTNNQTTSRTFVDIGDGDTAPEVATSADVFIEPNLEIAGDTTIQGDLTVEGTINGDIGQTLESGDLVSITGDVVDLNQAEKNQPDGWLGLDGDGALEAIIIHRSGTTAEIDEIVLEDGEIAVTTDPYSLRMGDGSTEGGLSVGAPASTASVSVYATSTPTANGAALQAAYAVAAALTPNGSAKSATNRATLLVHPGVYDYSSGGLTFSSFVDLIGIGQPTLKGVITWFQKDVKLHNFRIIVDAAFPPIWVGLSAGQVMDCRDLFFDTGGNTTRPCVSIQQDTGNWNGIFKRCRTDGTCLFGQDTADTYFTGCTATTLFEDCEGGNHSFGGNFYGGFEGGNKNLATIRRCRMFGTSSWKCWFGGTMEYCNWSGGLVGTDTDDTVATGAKIRFSRIKPASGKAIGDQTTPATISVSHCTLPASPFGSGVTNNVGTNYNVEDNDS